MKYGKVLETTYNEDWKTACARNQRCLHAGELVWIENDKVINYYGCWMEVRAMSDGECFYVLPHTIKEITLAEYNLDYTVRWLEDFKEKNNVKGVVLGLSGGKDSTVVAMLAKKVWGDNVVAVLMPNGVQKDISDSIDIVETLKLKHTVVNIKDTFDALVISSHEGITQPLWGQDNRGNFLFSITEKSKTNIAPRIRMTVLYAIAQSLGYLVIGTGNASETYIGWTTKWGDSAADLNPLKYILCTDVIELGKLLAKEFGLDEKYIVKKPADGLTNNTDEDNFGFTYDELDYYIKNGFPSEDTLLLPDNLEQRNRIEKIKQMHMWSEHKRKPVPGPEDK